MGISVAKLTNYSRNELKSPHKIIPGPQQLLFNYYSSSIISKNISRVWLEFRQISSSQEVVCASSLFAAIAQHPFIDEVVDIPECRILRAVADFGPF